MKQKIETNSKQKTLVIPRFGCLVFGIRCRGTEHVKA